MWNLSSLCFKTIYFSTFLFAVLEFIHCFSCLFGIVFDFLNPICTGGFSGWYDRGCANRAHPSEILTINCHYPISFIFRKFYLSLT
jgi:hypothetical protein